VRSSGGAAIRPRQQGGSEAAEARGRPSPEEPTDRISDWCGLRQALGDVPHPACAAAPPFPAFAPSLHVRYAVLPEGTRRLETFPVHRKSAKGAYPPGQHGQAVRKRFDTPSASKKEQKLRFNYGISEGALVRYVKKARAQDGPQEPTCLKLLRIASTNISSLRFGPRFPVLANWFTWSTMTVNGRVVDDPQYKCPPGT